MVNNWHPLGTIWHPLEGPGTSIIYFPTFVSGGLEAADGHPHARAAAYTGSSWTSGGRSFNRSMAYQRVTLKDTFNSGITARKLLAVYPPFGCCGWKIWKGVLLQLRLFVGLRGWDRACTWAWTYAHFGVMWSCCLQKWWNCPSPQPLWERRIIGS